MKVMQQQDHHFTSGGLHCASNILVVARRVTEKHTQVKTHKGVELNLEFHHRLEHDLRHNELWSVLAVNIAHNLPAIKTFLLKNTYQHCYKTNK